MPLIVDRKRGRQRLSLLLHSLLSLHPTDPGLANLLIRLSGILTRTTAKHSAMTKRSNHAGAFAVTLTWLPILAIYLAVPDEAAQGMPELSAATLERLWQPSRQGQHLAQPAAAARLYCPDGSPNTGSRAYAHVI